MSDLTKAQLSARVLEHLGVKDATDAADAADNAMVEETIDAAYDRLRKFGLVPFDVDEIPSWAQTMLRDYVAGDVAQSFGKDDPKWKQAQIMAERELRRQVSGYKHNLRVRPDFF